MRPGVFSGKRQELKNPPRGPPGGGALLLYLRRRCSVGGVSLGSPCPWNVKLTVKFLLSWVSSERVL